MSDAHGSPIFLTAVAAVTGRKKPPLPNVLIIMQLGILPRALESLPAFGVSCNYFT